MKKFDNRYYQDEASDAAIEVVSEKLKDSMGSIIVLPTGAGKTHVISLIIEKYLKKFNKKILVLSHVKEILQQNYSSLSNYLDMDIGLYSSGLDSATICDVTVAGIQSVHRKSHLFDDVGLVLIDECHLVNDVDEGMYRKFMNEFSEANVIGLTATPFRARGYIHLIESSIFGSICYDLSSKNNFNRLVKEGYLCRLISKATDMDMDTKGVHTIAGDYVNKELDLRFNTDSVTEQALVEVLRFTKKYKKILIFAINIDHAERIRELFNEFGVNTGIVHSEMDDERETVIDRFKEGFYHALVNVNVLTTGFDVPDIDLIVLLRPTKSLTVYVQSVGRGLRVSPNKTHCLVLDFAGNTAFHGPINDVNIKQKGESKGDGEPITKNCPKCNCINHPKNKYCDACNHEFEFKVAISNESSVHSIVAEDERIWVDVDQVMISRHKKAGKPDSVRVDYECGLRIFSQWMAINSISGYAAHKAKYSLSEIMDLPEDFSYDIKDILNLQGSVKKPKRILVNVTERYPRIEETQF